MVERKILVVDDEKDVTEFVTAILEGEGTTIICAADGEEGLKAAKNDQPDLIILDVQMPKKDGFAVFHELRQSEATKQIPVIMLTGIREKSGIGFSKSDMGEFFGQEPNAYIEKPFDRDTLTTTVEKVLSQ